MTYARGDRFEAKRERDAGKVIEVREVLPGTLLGGPRYRVQSEANPKNPSAVGRHTTISEKILNAEYKKISR